MDALKNYTPHQVLTYCPDDGIAVDLPQVGNARCTEEFIPGGSFPGGQPLTRLRYGEVTGLPEPEPGTVCVVSQLVVNALPDRTDLAFPAGLSRDGGGTIVGFRFLARPAASEQSRRLPMAYWKSTLTSDELQRGDDLGEAPPYALPETPFNPDGRCFISYRSVDGRDLADEFQTRLRAAGLSAWRDDANLGLGKIQTRLLDALRGEGLFVGESGAGLAGAILIATPRVWTSEPVRHIEAPVILQLAERYDDDGFQLAVANAVPASSGGPAAMKEADAVYGLDEEALSAYLAHDVLTVPGRERIVRHFLERRVARRIDALAPGQPLKIDVDSRQPLDAMERPSKLYDDSDLMVRLHQEGDRRWPARAALDAFATAMAHLAPRSAMPFDVPVQVSGSIHPTIALGLGATFSTTRPGQIIECLHERRDQKSAWRSDAPDPAVPRTATLKPCPGGTDAGSGVLVMIVATCTTTDQSAFDQLAKNPGIPGSKGFKAIHRIELDRWDPIEAEEGNALARWLAEQLGVLAAQGEPLHVAFVGPWALALLLGHHLTTTKYVSYEWDNNAEAGPVYQPCLRINPGVPRHLTVVAPQEPPS